MPEAGPDPAAVTPPVPSRWRRQRVGQWTLVVVSALLLALALTTVIPPWSMAMLVLHLVAGEEGVRLLVLAGLVLALTALPSPHHRLRLAAAMPAGIAGILLAIPLCTLPQAIRFADAECARAYGAAWLARLPEESLGGMRRQPFSVRDALLGMPPAAAPAIRIAIPAADGTALMAFRYGGGTPAGPRPVVVVIHGGGWRGGEADECDTAQRYLGAHGYLVYAIDYRTAPATRFPGQLDDVRAALAWIVAHAAEAGGDAARLVVMGRSAGAQLAALVAYAGTGPAVCAVVAWYGPTDLAIGYRELPHPDPLDVRARIGDYLGGTPDEEPALYARASPIAFATRPLPPTLLISGGSDHVVLMGYQRQMRDRLAASGTRAALIELPWAEHGFDHLANGPGAQISLYYLERFLAWATTR